MSEGELREIDEHSFSYHAWYPWSRLPGMLLLAATLVVCLFVFVRPSSLGQLVPYWFTVVTLTAFTLWWVRLLLQGFTQPHSIAVTRRGIIGRPIYGSATEIEWDQVESVEEARARFPRKPLEETRVRAHDGKVLIFNEDLPGYNELKRIVLDRATRGRQ